MPEPYVPKPRRPVRQRTADSAMHWLARLFRADVAIGPLEKGFTLVVFFLAGLVVGGALGDILPLPSLLCRLIGAGIGLAVAGPARKLPIRWGQAGVVGATLLAILVSCGAGSVGQLAALTKGTVTAYRLESGDNTILATGPARGCQIAINEFNLGLLSEEEMREQCGDSLAPAQVEEGEKTALRIPKPSFLLFVWAGIQILLVAVVLVFIFRKPPP